MLDIRFTSNEASISVYSNKSVESTGKETPQSDKVLTKDQHMYILIFKEGNTSISQKIVDTFWFENEKLLHQFQAQSERMRQSMNDYGLRRAIQHLPDENNSIIWWRCLAFTFARQVIFNAKSIDHFVNWPHKTLSHYKRTKVILTVFFLESLVRSATK